HQLWGNHLSLILIYLLYGFRFTDMGPFRAIRYDALMKLDMKDPTWGWNAEMQIKAVRADLRIKEVAVSYRERIGRSKISGTVWGAWRPDSESSTRYSGIGGPQFWRAISPGIMFTHRDT